MATTEQSTVTIILVVLVLILFFTGLILFISSIISRRRVNKMALPTLEEITGVAPVNTEYNDDVTESVESEFFFEDDDGAAIDELVLPTVEETELAGATRSEYKSKKNSKKKLFKK